MSVSEAPIKLWHAAGYPPYRDFPRSSIPTTSNFHMWFTPQILLVAGVLAVGGTGTLMLITGFTIWVVRGFRRQEFPAKYS